MRIGIDLGGSKIEVAVLAPDGSTMLRERIATPRGNYSDCIDAITSLTHKATAIAGPVPVGIGIPGSLSPATGLVRNAGTTPLNGHPLDRDLAEAIGRPVRVENDANCFALAEARAGAGRDAHTVFGVILGTGVGGGLVVNGALCIGRNRIAGEWGHTPLPRAEVEEIPGPPCFCGRRGCVESWCAGPALAADHRRVTGQDLAADQLATSQDPAAAASRARHVDRLARALSVIVNVVDPDVIVLGGGLSNMTHLYSDLPKAMRPHIFSDTVATEIVPNRLGDSAGVIGAAWLWPAQNGDPA